MKTVSAPSVPHIAATMAKAIMAGKESRQKLSEKAAREPEKFISMVRAARERIKTPVSYTGKLGKIISGPSWQEFIAGFSEKTPAFSFDMWMPFEKTVERLTLNIFHVRMSGRNYEELAMTTIGKLDPDYVDIDLCGCTFRSIASIGGSGAYARFSDLVNSPKGPQVLGHWEIIRGQERIARGNIFLFAGKCALMWNSYARGRAKSERGQIAKRLSMILARHFNVFAHTEMAFSINNTTCLEMPDGSGGVIYINNRGEHALITPEQFRPEAVSLKFTLPKSGVPAQANWRKSREPCNSCGAKTPISTMVESPHPRRTSGLVCSKCADTLTKQLEKEKYTCGCCGKESKELVALEGMRVCPACRMKDYTGREFPASHSLHLRQVPFILKSDGSVITGIVHRSFSRRPPTAYHVLRFDSAEHMNTTFRSLSFTERQRDTDQKVLVLFSNNRWEWRYAKSTFNYANTRYNPYRISNTEIHVEFSL